MDRRDFVERAGLSALAVLAGACTPGGGITSPVLESEVTVDLAAYPTLDSTGEAARIQGVRPPVALVHESDGTYRAFSLVCPHAGTTVGVGSEFVCPNHGARFDLHGSWIGGQPTFDLHEYPTTFDPEAGTVVIAPA